MQHFGSYHNKLPYDLCMSFVLVYCSFSDEKKRKTSLRYQHLDRNDLGSPLIKCITFVHVSANISRIL